MKRIMVLWIMFTICASAQTLSNLYFLDENIGWIQSIDSHNYPIKSYKTTNGGVTWTKLDSQYNFMSIQFLNDSIGFLFATDGQVEGWWSGLTGTNLYKTTDEGETWQFVTDSIIGFGQVEFADENIGYARYRQQLFKTINGGYSWNFITFSETMFRILATNKSRVLRVDNKNLIVDKGLLLSKDYGESWTGIRLPLPYEYKTQNIIFVDSMNGYITNRSYDGTQDSSDILHTNDGGLTWNYIVPAPRAKFISMIDNLNGIIYSGSNYYYITHDGFTTWEYKFSNSLTRSYLFKGCKEFYAFGDSGYFAKSTDCGDTWTEIPFVVSNPTTSVENNSLATYYSLEQNYPNPFNPSTRINFNLLSSGMTTIKVYDVLGKEIATLINEYQTSGNHYVDYDANELNSGVYFYKINSGEFIEVKKMVFIK